MVKIQVNSQGKAYYTSTGKVLLAPEGSGAQVRAKNYTGSNILEGDKVWINRENGENKLVTFDNDVYNIASSNMHNVTSLSRYFTPVTNNAKYLSISSSSIPNFISSLFTSSSNDFELVVKFFVNSASEHSRIFSLQTDAVPGSSFFTWCSLSEDSSSLKKISSGFSYAYNAWDGINLDTEIEDNTWYYLIYNRSSGKLSLSLAKNSLNNVIETVTNSRNNVVFYCSTSYTYIALAQTNSSYIPLQYDLSEISFNSSYQNINWKALDLGNITSDTQTGTAAENITTGATGLVNVGAVINPNSITATNNTGSTVNSGDKVWINQENGENRLENYLVYTTNTESVGNVTVSDNIASNFSSSNYLKTIHNFNVSNTDSWEICMCFDITSQTSTSLGTYVSSFERYVYGPFIAILNTGKINATISNGSSTITGFEGPTYQLNQKYWIKLSYNSGIAKGECSTNGNDFIEMSPVGSTSITGISINRQMWIGYGSSGTNLPGNVYLDGCYIKINGEKIWEGYEGQIVAPESAQTGIAAESITAGSAGLVNVASGVL